MIIRKTLYFILFLFITNAALAQTLYPVVWQEMTNVTVNANNSLTKTVPSATWDAGAVSEAILPPGQDGYIQFTTNTVGNYMVGLSKLNRDPSFSIGDFNIYINGSNMIQYRDGVSS